MSCREIVELLPWWLSGNLSEDEARAVEQHLRSCSACHEELRQTRLVRDLHGGHIPTEALVAHAFGEPLPSGQKHLVQSHLVHCERCRDELEMVLESKADMEATAEREPEWAPASHVIPTALRPVGRGWQITAVAASLAVLGLTATMVWILHSGATDHQRWAEQRVALESEGAALKARVGELESALEQAGTRAAPERGELERARDQIARLTARLGELRLPQVNAPIVRLFPASADLGLRTDGEGNHVNRIDIAGSAGRVNLILFAPAGTPAGPFAVDLLAPDGTVVWHGTDLHLTAEGEFTLALPTEVLPGPRFTIRVIEQGDRGHEVAAYRVE